MPDFFFTVTKNQYPEALHGAAGGYVRVEAETRDEARQKMHNIFGTRWSMEYSKLDDVHPFDRQRCIAIIPEEA